jgi:pyrroloquinoline-quinone synthase
MTFDGQSASSGPSDRVPAAVAGALHGRELLSHPFYRRWEAGDLSLEELGRYAGQYRAFEAALPELLGTIHASLMADEAVEAAELIARNLADELGAPEPHVALFDRFAAAVGTEPDAPAGPAARSLVATHRDLAADGAVRALAALAAYETQASAIASTKADGLRRWYGIDTGGTAFWDVHATMEADHGAGALAALAALDADPADVAEAARVGADAWWAFLDERQAEAPSVRVLS